MLCGALTYANSLSAPFLFDDLPSIVNNPYIRQLWPPVGLVRGLENAVTTARPLVGLSMALNYAISGLEVWSYHAFNVVVHVLAALAFFGVVRRTLLVDALRPRFGELAPSLAFACALLWMLHPLLTESVTYTSQRTESMMGLFYFLTLYCAIRAAAPTQPRWGSWSLASALACVAGVMSKQVIVTAPVMVVLWDWTFSTEPFARVAARRKPLYAALAGSWVLLGVLMWAFRDTNVAAGTDPWNYARAQSMVIVSYLTRAIWPAGLTFDYGLPVPVSWTAAAPYALLLVGLVLAAAVALYRKHPAGFAGAWVFVVLAPTSSFVPLATEVGAERRMYVPLAGVVVLAVVAGCLLLDRMGRHVPALALPSSGRGARPWVGLLLLIPCAAGLSWQTVRRNAEYRRPLRLWESAVTEKPENWRAHNNLGVALEDEGRVDEAMAEYRRALDLNPRYGPARDNLAKALHARNELDEAISHYRAAIDVEPTAPVLTDLGLALEAQGKVDEAAARYAQAIRVNPAYGDAHLNLGRALFAKGDVEQATEHYREALRISPDDARVHTVLGTALASMGKLDDAVAAYRRALALSPGLASARHNLGSALLAQGKPDEAIAEYRLALDGTAEGEETRRLIARALASQNRVEEATAEYEALFARGADSRAAANGHRDFGDLLMAQKRIDEAIGHYRLAARGLPDDPRAQFSLGIGLGLNGQPTESLEAFEAAVRLAPEWPDALIQLANALLMQPQPSSADRSRAVAMAEQAAELTGRRNPAVLRALAWVYSTAGQPSLAEATVRAAAELDTPPGGRVPESPAPIDSR